MENSWFARDRDVAGDATATKVAELGSKNVITSINASYSDATQAGTVSITIGAAAPIVLDLHGQLTLSGLDMQSGANEAIVAVLSAGGAGVGGSILLNGYTK